MRITITLCLMVGSIGCQSELESSRLGQPGLAVETNAIRNGTRMPEAVELTPGQILALGWLHPLGAPGDNFCTGTLVSPRVVATAKHCIEGRNGRRQLAFGMGTLPSDPDLSVAVETAIGHPQLDAAILILDTDVTDRLPEVEPIPFNRSPLQEALIGEPVQAGGYGETYDRRRSGRYFATVYVRSINRNEVVVDGRGQQGICFGDSGGPVISVLPETGPVVLGVESWGDPSCLGIDHLIRLDAIADWIDMTTAEATRPPDAECATVPAEGQCIDQQLRRCNGGRYIEIDCQAEGLECRTGEDNNRFGCYEIDLCARVGSTGMCDDDKVVRCRFGELVFEDCAATEEVCTQDEGGAFCSAETERPGIDASIAEDGAMDPADSGAQDGDVDGGLSDEQNDMSTSADMGDKAGQERRGAGGCQTGAGSSGDAGLLLVMSFSWLLVIRRRRRGLGSHA
ncbi:MAG: S1 family peptidase [Bradymonadia bacterium]